MQNNAVKWLVCGGTIDKVYYDNLDDYRFGEPAVHRILKRARVEQCDVEVIMQKDSLDLTAEDVQKIVATVARCPASRLIITHGTDTLVETAQQLQTAIPDKTIVCVGAFLPELFKDSDADFNLGFALAAATLLESGCYVAMNGRIFSASTVIKNRAIGRFETK